MEIEAEKIELADELFSLHELMKQKGVELEN